MTEDAWSETKKKPVISVAGNAVCFIHGGPMPPIRHFCDLGKAVFIQCVCVSNCIEHFMGVCKFNTYTPWERCKCCKEKYKNQPRPPHVCTQAERNASWPTNTANTQCRQHLTRPKYVVCHEKTLHHTTLLWPCAICIVHPFPSLLLSSSCRI